MSPLAVGARLGSYEIVAPLGAGGMGEVYRARDTKLNRDVALKVLPDLFAADPDRLARFQREAQLLASLNHPNIAAIYGLEGSDGVHALILELVEGETLAERLEHERDSLELRGVIKPSDSAGGGAPAKVRNAVAPRGLEIDEALRIARQIAQALEAAHEKGVIHRDLKPANIALTAEGQVKVLDFGLAKLLEPAEASGPGGPGGNVAQGFSPALTNSPTLSLAMTQAGVILGTAAYMSPEQAKGRPADKRADVWAFGCVLYEMLAGRRAFEGEDASDTLAAILRAEPDWTALPADVPDQIRLLLRRCLEKDRAARVSDVSTARFLMTETIAPPLAPVATVAALVARRRSLMIAGIGLVVGIGLAGLTTWVVMRPGPAPQLQPMRFAIVPTAAQPLAAMNADRVLAISPDGTHLVYVAGQGQLMVRAIDQLEATPLRGITDARVPFFSPDGKWIGFFQSTNEMRKVSVTGGPPITLCRINGNPRGASWGPDDTIVFATSSTTSGLLSVPAGGGEPRVLTKPDAAHSEFDHLFPSVLPGGRAMLFTITASGPIDNAQVAVLDLGTGQQKTLIRGGSHAEYVDPSAGSGQGPSATSASSGQAGSGQPGYLVYAAAGTLRAVRFDPARLQMLSDPVPVVEQVAMMGTGAAEYSVSRSGVLVYVPGIGGQTGAARSLVWVNRHGREEPIKAPPRAYAIPRLSPDGTRIAAFINDQENDIWIWDLSRETLTRLTFDPGLDSNPIWTPDGRRIIFASSRAGIPNLFWQQADGTGTVERLTTSPNSQFGFSISPDGTEVVLLEQTPTNTGNDLMLLHLGNMPRTEPLIQTMFTEAHGEISPDGHWIAYASNESGQVHVYVRPFPNVSGGRWQVSTSAASRPVWARSGKELFYGALDGAIMAVPVQMTSTFSAGNPTKLFDWRTLGQPSIARTYDVSRDGQKFLMIKEGGGSDPASATPPSIVVVLNWVEELKGRVGR